MSLQIFINRTDLLVNQPINNGNSVFSGQTWNVPVSAGNFEVSAYRLAGITIVRVAASTTAVTPFTYIQSSETIVLAAVLTGQLVSDAHDGLVLRTGEHNTFYAAQHTGTFTTEEGKLELTLVYLDKNLFMEMVNRENAYHSFITLVKAAMPGVFSSHHLPVDAVIHQTITTLANYTGSTALKPLYYTARVNDLLVHQLSLYQRQQTQIPYIKTEYDKERIEFAHDYLLKNMQAPPTLTELALIAGINEFKLKKGFREMYHLPVFAYLAEKRLLIAEQALREKSTSITQLAFELGYASPQHFSAAFKKKFGVPPARFA